MSKNIKNPYPESFGYLRIGTPINADLNKINISYNAFDMGMLSNEHYLVFDANTIGSKKSNVVDMIKSLKKLQAIVLLAALALDMDLLKLPYLFM